MLGALSPEKSKIMTNSTNSISADMSMKDQKLEEVTSFKYLGVTLCKDGTCSTERRWSEKRGDPWSRFVSMEK